MRKITFIVILLLSVACNGMFHKKRLFNQLSSDSSSEENDVFRAADGLKQEIQDMLLANDVSAHKAYRLLKKANKCKLPGFKKLAKAGKKGRIKKNLQRDLLNTIMKDCKWKLRLYYAQVRCWDVMKQCTSTVWLPFLLPHEMIYSLAQKSALHILLNKGGMAQTSRLHLEGAEQELQTSCIGLGLWGDGVPCNYDRSQSLEVWSLNLPGLPAQYSNLRLPSTVMNKRYVLNKSTSDDVLAVVRWSLEHCAMGTMPSARHDHLPWRPEDHKRRKLAGAALPPAVLCEVRGDWQFYKQVFRLPQQKEKKGCCWKCEVTPRTFRNCSIDAPWRTSRLGHWQLLQRMNLHGLSRSPLFGAPCCKSSIFQVDWLHTGDKGVTADFLGNLFHLLISKMPGGSKEDRLKALFLEIRRWYAANPVDSKLDNLTHSMIGKENGPYSLKCKAAEARNLVAFAVYSANTWLSSTDPQEQTVQQAAFHLQGCYNQLTRATFDHSLLKEHSRKFALLSVALESASPGKAWRVKPKLHLFQEMCEMQSSCPSTCWTYRDEDFGGTMMQIGRRRGGSNNPVATAKVALCKFMARNPIPSLV